MSAFVSTTFRPKYFRYGLYLVTYVGGAHRNAGTGPDFDQNLNNLRHGTESFLRSQQVLSYSRNSPHFMESEGSLPHAQECATCPYPETDQFSLCPPILLSEDPFYYYPPIHAWIFQMVSCPQVPPPKPCMHFSHILATCPAHLFLS